MNRRLIIFLILCILILGTAGGVLFYFSKKQDTVPTETKKATGPLGINKILDEAVISPIASFDNNSIWYFNQEGRLFKVNVSGSDLSEFALPSVAVTSLKRVLWPKTGSDFIVVSTDGQKNYFNSKDKTFAHLASNIQYLDWLPDGRRVAYIWKSNDGKSQQLMVSDADGSGFHKVASVFWPDLVVKAGNDGKSALLYRSTIADTNKIYLAQLETGVVTTLIDSGKNTAAAWLPSGGRFLYTQTVGNNPSEVFFYNIGTKQNDDLKISTALERIAMDPSGKFIYAAVAKEGNKGDMVVKIDLSSLKSEIYFTGDQEMHVKNLFLAGDTLYFTDSRDNKLYSISR